MGGAVMAIDPPNATTVSPPDDAAIVELGTQAIRLLKLCERGGITGQELADMLWSRAHLLALLPKTDAEILINRTT